VGGKEVPGGEIQVPKRCGGSQFQLKSLHGGSEELAGDGGSSSMPHESLEVLDGLGGVEVVEIKALDGEGSVNDGTRHVALHLGLSETCFENWFHESVALFAGQGGCHWRVFQGLQDGVIQAVPSIVFGNVLGSNCVCPFLGFGEQELKLVGLISIGSSHGS
jgi:hypothetical protein